MSAPVVAPDSQKKKHRGPRRRNAAASNPPKPEAQQPAPLSAPAPPRMTQASHLLAQLAAAQGSNTPHTPHPQPSTSQTNTPKNNKDKAAKQQPKSGERRRYDSVGARMSAKHPPPPAPSAPRNRTVSQSAKKEYDTTYRGPKIPEDVLDNISFRFILNIPDSERLDETRICFQIELAHWFYVDFYVNQEERADCINMGMRDFLKQIFQHNDFLKKNLHRADEVLDNWRNYKSTVPTYGGILLDSSLNHALLVQGFYASKNSWGFPKGKVNEQETPRNCAVREVKEETGFDFGLHSTGANEYRIQKMVNDTMVRLYVVKDVPMDYKFAPETRCEIRKMKWFNIWDLPLDRSDQVAAAKGFPAKNFYSVVPFVNDLQNYVKRELNKRDKEGETKKAKKGMTLNNGKKNSAFTKVEKMSPCERAWMESVATETMSETVTKHGDTGTPSANDTLFKPLGETGGAPPGSNLAIILAHSSAGSTPRNASTSKTAVAHPVAIRPHEHPVYEAPDKEDKCKVASSLISNLWSSVPSSSNHSASQVEDALNKILFQVAAPLEMSHSMPSQSIPAMERDSSIDGDEEVKECVPALSQEPPLPALADLCVSVDTSLFSPGRMDIPSASNSLRSSNFRMPESFASRRARIGSLKLRRLTQAYLTPLEQLKKDSSGQKTDEIYGIIQDLILNYQSVTSGLFPRSSKDKSIGYVKDSIYCAMACWACSTAYERMDDDRGRQTELLQSAVKTMRGILFSWMQQVEELNTFKNNNLAKHALHARFDLETGLPIENHDADHGYGHLQMDLIALYIIAMVQMISAGAKIIFTHDEVCFVQNLVFYIERTYRTPDFGMWERGTRYNRGQPELHASSLGMVKAALEAVNGFNLYGSAGTSASVVYVDIDGHDRNRTTFEAILPRESNSKNTDSALLITVGWPAFATHNKAIFDKTVTKCIKKLEGKYGMKRFLRDGHLTELEDNTRPYYEEHETYKFESIESQFPLFFACIAITAKLKGEEKIYEEYWNKLQALLVSDTSVSGGWILPECYYVDEVNAEEEKKHGGTELSPVSPSEFGHHLWSNAVYIILLLLRDNLIHPGDLDPINRRMPASQRPKNLNRHSAFQGSMEGADPVVQMAIISESSRLQSMLSTYGIPSQTPHEVEPIQIWPSARMVKVFECLGRSKRLGLSGRPSRPFGALGTSKVFRVFGDTILCYPLLFEVKDFYLSSDPAVLIDNIKRDVEFVAKRWKLDGRPTMCIVLREENVAGEYLDHILDLLVQLKNGYVNGVRVRLGRVHQLLNSACVEHIDFASSHDIDFDVSPLEETQGGQLLASHTSLKEGSDEAITEAMYLAHSDHELSEIVIRDSCDSPRSTAFAIWILLSRRGEGHEVNGVSLTTRLDRLYRRACSSRSWWLVRYCAGRLKKTMNSLAPGITSILVRGKQVTLGDRRVREVTLNKPHTPVEIVHLLFSSCPPDDPQSAVMQQELIIACADLISHSPDVFNGVLTIRLSWLQEAIKLLLQYVKCSDLLGTSGSCPPTPQTTGIPSSVKRCDIYDLSPTVIKDVVRALMTKEHWHLLSNLQTRRLNGSLNRVPTDFYDRVWKILERSEKGIVIAGQYLPQQPTLSDMTQFELNFSYKLEEMMSTIVHPEYRQLIVELLCIVATILERNPEVAFHDKFDCEEVIWKAFHLFADQEKIEQRTDLRPFYQLENVNMKTSTATYLTKAIVELILNSRHISKEFDIHHSRKRADSPKEIDTDNACSVS